jgi:hypothetical protein
MVALVGERVQLLDDDRPEMRGKISTPPLRGGRSRSGHIGTDLVRDAEATFDLALPERLGRVGVPTFGETSRRETMTELAVFIDKGATLARFDQIVRELAASGFEVVAAMPNVGIIKVRSDDPEARNRILRIRDIAGVKENSRA